MIKVSSVNNSLFLTFKKPNMWQWMTAFYVLYTFMAILGQFMNYASVFIFIFILFCAVKNRGRIVKRPVAFVWCLWILIYPILDNFLRGEYKLQLYELLSYGTVILFLIFADDDVNNVKGLLTGFKIIAWFNVFGILLQNLIPRLHTIIAWRLLGMWSYDVRAFTSDSTAAAFLFAIAIGIVFAEFLCEKNRLSKAIKLLEFIILFISLILTTKRSMLIAVIVAVFVEYIITSLSSWRQLLKALAIEIVIVLLGIGIALFSYTVLGSESGLGRLGETIIGIINEQDVSSLRSLWAQYMNEWRLDNTWFGIGWESFKNRIYNTPYGGTVPNGHNVYLQIMCEEGYIGLILFLLILVVTLIIALNNALYYSRQSVVIEKKLALSSLSIFINFVIYIGTGNGIYDACIYLYFFAGILLISVLDSLRRKGKNGRETY